VGVGVKAKSKNPAPLSEQAAEMLAIYRLPDGEYDAALETFCSQHSQDEVQAAAQACAPFVGGVQ
jgi:hypothetical protein